MKKILYTIAILAVTFIAGDILLTGKLSSQRVALSSVENCRQLGGYVNVDGKTVKQDKLIRSGKLHKLDDDGKEILRKMGVNTIIDLRIPEEIADKPDPVIEGVENIRINLADPKSSFYWMSVIGIGVNAENYDERINAIAHLDKNLGDMYIEGIIDSPYGREALKKVFSLLADPKRKAILWHCSGGKDRTGIVAALLLSVLNVDHQTILDDYELTNEFVEYQRIAMGVASNFFSDNEAEKERIATIAGVKREFMEATLLHIDRNYGSPLQYLTEQVGVTEAEMQSIRKKFLE